MNHFILSREIAYRKLQRMAYEIVERNNSEDEIILAGIKESGMIVAKELNHFLKDIFKGKIQLLEITIDKKNPGNISLSLSVDFNNKVIIVVDDVSNSGKTLLYSLKPFLVFYPKKIQTLALVERSHREFPVSPDYVGMSIATALSERIVVETEDGKIMGARIE